MRKNKNNIKLNGINAIKKYISDKISTDGTCNNSKCPPNQCCSKNGLCGTGKEYCANINNMKINNGDNAIDNYNKELNDKFDDMSNNNLIYLSNEYYNFCGRDSLTEKIYKCKSNQCCYNNKCGIGYDYCELAEPNNKYHGDNAINNYNINRISTNGICLNKICPDNECCSNDNKCGSGDVFCNKLNNKFNGNKSLQYIYDKNNFVTDFSLNICGINNNQIYKCNPGYCCQENGKCTLDCSNSFINKYDDDIIENITFYINNQSTILKLKISELKNINSKFLNIQENNSYNNYAIRHNNNKIYHNDDVIILINELLNKEYNRNKLNGNNAIIDYINNKKLDTYNNGLFLTSNTNNCYIDHINNVNYKCPDNMFCNYNKNICSDCNNDDNKTIDNIVLTKLDGDDTFLYLFYIFIIILLTITSIIYIDKYNNNIKKLFRNIL